MKKTHHNYLKIGEINTSLISIRKTPIDPVKICIIDIKIYLQKTKFIINIFSENGQV